MNLLLLLFYQLFFYGPLPWLTFVGIAYGCARSGGMAGMFAGHFLVAALVIALDIAWVRQAMAAPGWNGTPDMDVIFTMGCVFRIVMINTLLLIVTWWGLRARRRSQEAQRSAQTPA